MAEPTDMRFHVAGMTAEPAGHKARPLLRGRPRATYAIGEAAKLTGWSPLALVALYNATYPPAPDEDDGWVDDYAEALYDPAVRKALSYFVGHVGTVPSATFLLALLVEWDMSDDENKAQTLLEAAGVKPCKARTWFTGQPTEGGTDE